MTYLGAHVKYITLSVLVHMQAILDGTLRDSLITLLYVIFM